ncbi:hypothetical protein GCM10027592_61910 [Spirosoma flavus]
MGLFGFFKKKKESSTENAIKSTDDNTPANETSKEWTGKDFEFLITGEIDIPSTE